MSRWLESLRIRDKLAVVFAVQLTVLTLGGLSVLLALREMSEARRWTEHTHQVIERIQALRASALEQQTGLRGYIITTDARFLEPYREGTTRFDEIDAKLRVQIADNPAQLARLDRVGALLREWQGQVAQLDIAEVESGHPELASTRTASGAGKRRMDAIKQLAEQMIEIEHGLLEQRSEQVAFLERLLYALFIGLVVLGWLTAVQAVVLINRGIGAPLSRLAALLPRVSAGDAVDVPYQVRRDEVGVLARAFEQLRLAIVGQREREWVAAEGAGLMSALQQCDSDASFGQGLLNRLSTAVNAGYAMAYRWNETLGLLEWCAAYGLPDASATQRRFKLGEGMVGQCIVERRLIELHPVPEGYLKIASGLGAALPTSVLYVPITARGETVAVLELGLLERLRPVQRELLDQVVVTSGLAWSALSRSVRTRELLEDSQAMTEELQAQQEALRTQQDQLRAVNEALRTRSELLEEQGRRLRASDQEQRAQAEELRVTNAALEEKSEALRARQVELETMRDELQRKAIDLEQASRYKSEFLANMSHELRTPLNSMLILSKTLADNGERNLDAEQVESARIIHDSGRSLLNLINDILDLSKVEAGKMSVSVDALRLADCLNALVQRFRPVAQERGLEFSLQISSEVPDVLHTDGERLTQILSNLLSNALKFTHVGKVELRAARVPEGVAISVRDSGIGIAAEKLAKVFQAFEQADSGTSRRYGGTGLGLSIVDRMTALLGGTVRVHSEEGQGSTFTVVLPLTPPAAAGAAATAASTGALESGQGAAPGPAASAPSAPPRGPAALLIVEDDASFARVLADIARRRGVETLVASSGAQALELARQRRLVGVLLDIGLPDMSGWDVLERLKSDPLTAVLPVHIVSGAEDVDRGRALGAVGFLRKPVEREAILEVLSQVAGPADGMRRLLLVDDDAVTRASVRKLLLRPDLEIVEVATGEAGLAQLHAQRFDGLVLDLNLPDLSGFEFLERASREVALPPVVINSARELTPEELLRLRAHTQSVVVKGARSPERLLDEVHLFLHAIEPAGVAPAPAAPHMPMQDLAGKTVLVVDDDMRNVFALSKALRAHGLEVVMAQDGHKALSQLETRAGIDLVLMDIMMPGMDGYETIRRIRAQTRWQALPIIAVTAKAMKGDREKCIEAGANDYCPKPIDIERLVSQLRVWI